MNSQEFQEKIKEKLDKKPLSLKKDMKIKNSIFTITVESFDTNMVRLKCFSPICLPWEEDWKIKDLEHKISTGEFQIL